MPIRSVGFQLKSDGKAEVKNDFAEVQKAGEQAMSGIADAAEEAAQRSSKSTDEYTDRQMASYQKQATSAKLAAARAQTNSTFDQALDQRGNGSQFSTVNLDRSTGAAKASASAFQEAFAIEEAGARAAAEAEAIAAKAAEDRAATATKLRAAIDPLSAAQARYDNELKSHDDLLAHGNLTEAEHKAAVALSTKALDDAKRALDGHTSSMGLNRIQVITAQSALMRFGDSVIAGRNPLTAFALEAHKGVEVLSEDDGGMAGGLAKVTSLLTPMNIGMAAGAAVVLTAAAAWYSYDSSMNKLATTAQGTGAMLGESAVQLEANAEAASNASRLTVGAARDLETGYALVARSGEVLVGLTAMTQDFAAATGQDMKAAQADLNKIFSDTGAGAEELAAKYGMLTSAQVEEIEKLKEEGQYTEAQIKLQNDISEAVAGAAEHISGMALAWDNVKRAAGGAFNAVGAFMSKYGQSAISGADAALGGSGVDFDWLFQGHGPMKQGKAQGDPRANATGAAALGLANSSTQFTAQKGLQDNLALINAALGSQASLAGMSAVQIDRLRTAQDQYNHAVTTFLPAGEKQAQLAQVQAEIIAAKGNPARERALAIQRANIENSGRLITSAQARADAEGKAEGAVTRAERVGQKHRDTLAREAAAMEVSANAAVDVAAAYLKSADAGDVAEARRKAMTDATRRGTDVDAQVARQMALSSAEQLVTSAKSIASMNGESAAREAVIARLHDGQIATVDMDQELKVELALRPLLAARAYLHGDALKTLNDIIAATPEAFKRAQAAGAQFDLSKALQTSVEKVTELRSAMLDLGHAPLDASLQAAQRSAQIEADRMKLPEDSDDRRKFVQARENEAQAQYDFNRAKYVHDTVNSQQDGLAVSQRELELVGASDAVRTVELDKLKLMQVIRRQFPDMAQADVDKLLAGVAAQDAMNERLKIASAQMSELRNFGDGFVDDVLSTDTWSSWGNAGKTVLKDLENEFLKLALLNPLKNLINGNSDLPSLTGVLGKLGTLFGGSGASSVDAMIDSDFAAAAPHNASGTYDFSGGRTYVNENGPELLDLPGGTQIIPASLSRQMIANDNGGGGDTHIHVYAEGAVLSDTVKGWVTAGMAEASVRGAAGGAALSEANSTAQGTRRLGKWR